MVTNGNGGIVYQSNTAGQGTPPCTLTVSGANGGSFYITDSNRNQLFIAPTPPANAPAPSTGLLLSGQTLPQVRSCSRQAATSCLEQAVQSLL